MNQVQSIHHQETELYFTVPNSLNYFRVNTFSTKEPETLEWIDKIPHNSILWDIGANVGLYSCYAAKARNCQVFAFEPSVFNLELLARNIFLNDLTHQITIISLPLTDQLSQSTLNMTSTDWGGALSTFGQNYGDDGRILKRVFQFQTIGISIDDAIQMFEMQMPDFIKMDVDGIEHLILKGSIKVLENVQSVLIEINEDFEKQAIESQGYLQKAGLVFQEKRHSEMFDSNPRFGNTYNQIWYRPNSI
ncbi:FkbM family methyltransferase [Spirulina sp. CCNP1310]|uniref:FkbM family methyltransferase n=1 Tax=Spirulina sp. CCNP1310 TaxID=3110249 RepID=UPI003A4C611E